MKFKVNDGQNIRQFHSDNGKPENRFLKGGDVVEGPAWWADEFRGRMTPVDDDGKPLTDPIQLAAMSGDLATAKAHERVGILEEMIAKNPSLAEALTPELDKARVEADQAAEAFRAKRATGPAAQVQKPRPVSAESK